MTVGFRNPVLAGSHPDPSICRVGDDYYLVTSTFEYFPGLPIHHSRDLVNWRLIGHAIDRPEQIELDDIAASDGLYAPTIRYAQGTFYVVCTLVGGRGESGNFVVTAKDPAGPWSQPTWLHEADGFDPSLFFDEDGRSWFCATTQQDDAGHTSVWVQEFSTEKLHLIGKPAHIWQGALRGARWAEAPHIYRIDGAYYLLAAEGGTSREHAVVVARSDEITGPYEGCERNPVLTARHLGDGAPVISTGHADLVQTPQGQWWAVLLGVRDGERGNLGRETFLTSVGWERGWPVFNPGVGHVRLLEEQRPTTDDVPWPATPRCDSFDGPALAPTWLFLRTPREKWWSLTDRAGHLRLRLRPDDLTQRANPSFICRRLQHRSYAVFTSLDFTTESASESAGLAVMHSDAYQLRFEVAFTDRRVLRVVRRAAGVDELVAEISAKAGVVRLGIEAAGPSYTFSVADGSGWATVAHADASHLSYQVAGGFFGAVVGIFATSHGAESTNVADFDTFEYAEIGCA
jgi:alpha-N-arabinofuranosidase